VLKKRIIFGSRVSGGIKDNVGVFVNFGRGCP